MTVLRERDGQALLKFDEYDREGRKVDVKFEWWYDLQKMRDGIRMEEKNGKTQVHCCRFHGGYMERWLIEEFDRRVPKHKVV